MTKAPNVKVVADKGKIRLQWNLGGKRHYLYLGLPDGKANRLKGQQLALEIEADIELGRFDTTLEKYKLNATTGKRFRDYSVLELFSQWLDYKSSHVTARTLEWYDLTANNLRDFFGSRRAQTISSDDAINFLKWLRQTDLGPETISRRIEAIAACWRWALKRQLCSENPWAELPALLQAAPPEKPTPFTKSEVRTILTALDLQPTQKQLAPFVSFLFGTGCRIGEAIGLRWKNVSANCDRVVICEQLTRGVRKAGKTKTRTIWLTPTLQGMLKDLRKPNPSPTDLVFTWNGRAINLNNFRRRVWEPTLLQCNIAYRRPYATRHTFISHALEEGLHPLTISQITGHSVKVLFDHYASALSKPKLPELF